MYEYLEEKYEKLERKETYLRLLTGALVDEKIVVMWPGMQERANEVVEMNCYRAIQRIYDIISDQSMEDTECFYKIEEIISILENMGLDCGGRHDF